MSAAARPEKPTQTTADQQPNSFAAFRGRWIEQALDDHKLPSGAVHLLVCLAHHFLHSQKRSCWPSQDTLVEKVGMPLRTVQRHLSDLQRRGHIEVKRQGRDRPNLYVPAFYDAPPLADQSSGMTRQKPSDDPPKSAIKTRHGRRTTTLKEPIEEHRQALRAPAKVGHTEVDSRDARRGASPDPANGYKVGDTIDVPGLGSGAISRVSARDKLGRIYIELPLPNGLADADAIIPIDPAGNICTEQVWWSDDWPERTSRIAWPDPVLTPAPARNSRKGKTDAA